MTPIPAPTCDFCSRPAQYACAGKEMGFARRPAVELRVVDVIRIRLGNDVEAKVTRIEDFGSRYFDIQVSVAAMPAKKKTESGSFRWPKDSPLWIYGPTPCSKLACEYCSCERGEGVHRCMNHWGIEVSV